MELSQLKTALALIKEITAFKFEIENNVLEELMCWKSLDSLEQEWINPSLEISEIAPYATFEEGVILKRKNYITCKTA